jgi:hypothetical protein
LHSAAFSILSNMSQSIRHMSSYVAHRWIRFFFTIAKRYLTLESQMESSHLVKGWADTTSFQSQKVIMLSSESCYILIMNIFLTTYSHPP